MTIQNLFVAELGDILKIQVECVCGAQFSYLPDKDVTLPFECPQCSRKWNDNFNPVVDCQAIEQVIKAVRNAREVRRKHKGLKINLVFDSKPSGDG